MTKIVDLLSPIHFTGTNVSILHPLDRVNQTEVSVPRVRTTIMTIINRDHFHFSVGPVDLLSCRVQIIHGYCQSAIYYELGINETRSEIGRVGSPEWIKTFSTCSSLCLSHFSFLTEHL